MADTALLVIDVQQGLFQKSTPIYRAAQLLGNINLLIERARAAGAPVIFVQDAGKTLPYGTPAWQLHPGLPRQATDLIIHKQHGNAFEDTPLQQTLVGLGVKRLVAVGLVTHGCVRATCLGAQALGIAVTLVEDGHSSYSKDAAALIEKWNSALSAGGAVALQKAADAQFSAEEPAHAAAAGHAR